MFYTKFFWLPQISTRLLFTLLAGCDKILYFETPSTECRKSSICLGPQPIYKNIWQRCIFMCDFGKTNILIFQHFDSKWKEELIAVTERHSFDFHCKLSLPFDLEFGVICLHWCLWSVNIFSFTGWSGRALKF